MTAHHDLDRQLTDFLRDGPTELPYESFDAVRDRTETTRQRVVIGPWRLPDMNKIVTFGLAAAAVAVALFIGAQLFGSPGGGFGGPADEPTPTPEPTATLEPTTEPTSAADGTIPVGAFTAARVDAGDPAITVSIPASGWTDGEIAIHKGDDADNVPEAAMLFWSWPAGTEFFVPSDPCQAESTSPESPATSADDIVARLADQASRDASEPVDVTIGGYHGRSIILHVPDDATPDECELDEFVMFGTPDDPLARYHQGPGQIDEVWFLDVEGRVVMIDAMYRSDTPAELVEEMRTIAESATFEVP